MSWLRKAVRVLAQRADEISGWQRRIYKWSDTQTGRTSGASGIYYYFYAPVRALLLLLKRRLVINRRAVREQEAKRKEAVAAMRHLDPLLRMLYVMWGYEPSEIDDPYYVFCDDMVRIANRSTANDIRYDQDLIRVCDVLIGINPYMISRNNRRVLHREARRLQQIEQHHADQQLVGARHARTRS